MQSHTGERPLLRRRFLYLLGAGTAGLIASACGSGATESGEAELTLVALFSTDHVTLSGVEQRLPFGIIDNGLELSNSSATATLIDGPPGVELSPVSVTPHLVGHTDRYDEDPDHQHSDIQRYYPLRVTLPEAGIYVFEVRVDDYRLELPVQAFEPDEVSVASVGDSFAKVATPTLVDPAGVSPVCTRFEQECGLHGETPASLLAAGRPFVLLVATPAYCSTAYCGPALEILITASDKSRDLAFIHAEVYSNPEEVGGNISSPDIEFAPIMDQLGLKFEPALYVVDSSGVIVERLDNVFDEVELDQAIKLII